LKLQQVMLVQSSWKHLGPGVSFGHLLFRRLFELDPSLRGLFRSDMEEQAERIVRTIGVVVDGLGKPSLLVPVLSALGRRHTIYGVQPKHYDTMGAAVLWALKSSLGNDYTDEIGVAWSAAYRFISHVMQQAPVEAFGSSGKNAWWPGLGVPLPAPFAS